jgi:hypothetical protein
MTVKHSMSAAQSARIVVTTRGKVQAANRSFLQGGWSKESQSPPGLKQPPRVRRPHAPHFRVTDGGAVSISSEPATLPDYRRSKKSRFEDSPNSRGLPIRRSLQCQLQLEMGRPNEGCHHGESKSEGKKCHGKLAAAMDFREFESRCPGRVCLAGAANSRMGVSLRAGIVVG